MTLVAFVGSHDWANLCNRIARALERRGGELRARVITLSRHPFGYQEDVILGHSGEQSPALPEARAVVRDATWVVHSGDGDYRTYFALLDQLRCPYGDRRKRWAVTHAGSAYRANHAWYDELDQPCERRFLAMDNMRLALDDPRARPYVAAMGDYAWRLSPPHAHEPLVVCHTPSRRVSKGTARIVAAMPDAFRLDLVEGVSCDEAFSQRAIADVYIDQDNPDAGGFGASALEALCQGVACLANVCHVGDAATRWIPMPPIAPLTPRTPIAYWLSEFMRNPESLRTVRELGLAWCRRHVSDAAIAAYWGEALR